MPHSPVREANKYLARGMRQAMTGAELRLWLRLRNRGLEGYRFRRQAPLGPYIVDFFCPERKLVVEVDGDQHGFDAGRVRDAIRSRWLEAQGHTILRVSNNDVISNIEGVCAAIVDMCRKPTS